MRRSQRKSQRKGQRKSHRRKKTKSKSRSGKGPSVHNSMPKCVQLFKKYKLTNQSKMVKWMTKNHPDHANARGSKQSSKLQGDYKFITGCFANRKRIFQAMKSSKTKSKSTSKSKKKVKEIKGGGPQPPLVAHLNVNRKPSRHLRILAEDMGKTLGENISAVGPQDGWYDSAQMAYTLFGGPIKKWVDRAAQLRLIYDGLEDGSGTFFSEERDKLLIQEEEKKKNLHTLSPKKLKKGDVIMKSTTYGDNISERTPYMILGFCGVYRGPNTYPDLYSSDTDIHKEQFLDSLYQHRTQKLYKDYPSALYWDEKEDPVTALSVFAPALFVVAVTWVGAGDWYIPYEESTVEIVEWERVQDPKYGWLYKDPVITKSVEEKGTSGYASMNENQIREANTWERWQTLLWCHFKKISVPLTRSILYQELSLEDLGAINPTGRGEAEEVVASAEAAEGHIEATEAYSAMEGAAPDDLSAKESSYGQELGLLLQGLKEWRSA